MDQTTLAALGPCIAAIKDIVVGLAAAAAAFFAYLGLNTWRKELKGKSEYELAKRVLKSVYRVREAFMHVRNPAIYQYEYPEDMRNHHGHLKPEHNYDGTTHVYEKRWEKMHEAFKELEEAHLEAQVEWGPKHQNVIVKLRVCRATLLTAIQQMLDRKKDPHQEPRKSEEIAEERSVLEHLGTDSKHDKFTPQIEEALNEFEKWLRPHIKHRG